MSRRRPLISLNAKTKLCAILGNPVNHSLSPAIHNAAFQALGLNYVYVAFQVSDISGAVNGIRALGVQGVSITIPHKEAIIPLLDEVDELALKIGAVNTVLNQDGVLKGYNTDSAGILYALAACAVKLTGTKVLLLGAGGAARAAAFSLAMRAGISSLTILNRNEDRAAQLASDVREGCSFSAVTSGGMDDNSLTAALSEATLVINGTPLGMNSQRSLSPLGDNQISEEQIAFDMVYTPIETAFIQQAKKVGAQVVTGDLMFLKQAAEQFYCWTGKDAPEEVMRHVLFEALS